MPAQVALVAPPPGDAPDPLIEAALARQPRASDQQPECRVRPIRDGMQVTATLPPDESALAEDVAMELAGKDIWVSAPETRAEGARLVAQADFVAASGKPFPLDPAALRLTLIGAQDAVEFIGCRPEG